MKKIVTIQDISCFGKCSLTVALPIISAMGIETAVIPTAVLSTHTGGFEGYTFHDLSADISDISAHWKSLGLKFDAIYTGYLGSAAQVKIVSDFFDNFGDEENFIVVDPVLGDHGRLYAGFTDEFVSQMRHLCKKADYIMPNMTEASFLLGIPYREADDEYYVKDVLKRLSELGCRVPVLTGVRFGGSEGAVAYDRDTGEYYSSFGKHVERQLHGTGDIFASVFTGAVTLGKSVQQALDIAVKYISECIEVTLPCADEVWYGSCFELCLDKLIGYTKGNF
ncbi:MAG: pyridoxamine kinase [Ruminococcus sp.]|nr:pyridoxamine kinase [Ruminococcus sp.]